MLELDNETTHNGTHGLDEQLEAEIANYDWILAQNRNRDSDSEPSTARYYRRATSMLRSLGRTMLRKAPNSLVFTVFWLGW